MCKQALMRTHTHMTFYIFTLNIHETAGWTLTAWITNELVIHAGTCGCLLIAVTGEMRESHHSSAL